MAFWKLSFGDDSMNTKSRQDPEEQHNAASAKARSKFLRKCTQEQVEGDCSSADLASLSDSFYRALAVRLARIAGKIGVPKDLCEDVAQEALLEAFKKREQFQGEFAKRRFCFWIVRFVVRHRAADLLRRISRERKQSLDVLADEPMDCKEAKRVMDKEANERLTKLLARLRQREPENHWLLCEHHLEGRSIQGLADETGRTANEIRCRIYRGMQKLRQWATPDYPDDEISL